MLKVVLTVDSHIRFDYKKLKKEDKHCYVELIKNFTYHNPTYYKNEKMHFSNKGVPKKIQTYKKLKHEIVFNRGGIKKIKKILKKHGHVIKIHDHRLEFEPVQFDSNIILRHEQKEPVKRMLTKKQGIVRGPCSCVSGDTHVFIKRGDKEFYITVERLLHHIESGNFDTKPTLIQAVNMHVPPKLVWTKIEKVIEKGKKYTVNLKLENKVELRATPDHPILTPNGYKPLGDITALDQVYVDLSKEHVHPIRVVSVSKPKFVKTYDISCPDHRCFTANDVVVHNSGKTVMLYQAIAKAKQPTVVVVWNTIHQKQWFNEAQKFLGLKKSEIGGCGGIFKKPKFGVLNLCMEQSLCKKDKLEFFADRTGFVAGDEVQRYGARTFQETINDFPAKYRIGVSANERRKDGKQFLIYDSFGNVICEIEDKNVGSRRPSRVFLIPTDFHSEEYDETRSTVNLLTEMAEDQERNELILKAVKRSIKKGKQCLILTERRHQALFFKFALSGYRVGLLLGHVTTKELKHSDWPADWKKFIKNYDSYNAFEKVQKLAEKKKLDVIVSTKKGDVGLSVRTIDHTFITTPTATNMERFNQQKGRCERDYNTALEEKFGVKATPHVYYFWDVNHPDFQKAGNRVIKKYKGQIFKLKGK